MSEDPTPETDLLGAALTLIERDGWRRYSALALAQATGANLAEVCLQLGDRRAVLAALGHRANAAMVHIGVDELGELDARERVFELLMRRFEALRPARPALAALRRELAADALLQALGNLRRAMRLVMAAAGLLDARGAREALLLAALARAYVRTGRVWLDDDSEDQSATLAELDRQLGLIAGMLRDDGRVAGASG